MNRKLTQKPTRSATRRGARPSFEALEDRQLLASSLGSFFSGFFPSFSSPSTNNPSNKYLTKVLKRPVSQTYPPFDITLQAHHLSDPGGTGVVFGTQVAVEGQAVPYATVWMAKGPNGFFNSVTHADATGYYSFNVTVPSGRTTQIRTFAEAYTQSYSTIATTQITAANPVVAWDALARFLLQKEYQSDAQAARGLAILHQAQYDAVAAATGQATTDGSKLTPIPGASAVTAANSAAATVLAGLYPAQAPIIATALAASLFGKADTPALKAGDAIGQAAAKQVLQARSEDGATEAAAAAAATTVRTGVVTYPDYSQVRPFAITQAAASFRPTSGPPAPKSAAFDQALAEVVSLGRDGSVTRTADQTEAAHFWADFPGRDTDPAHWNLIAEEQATTHRLSLLSTARLFKVLDATLADTAIATASARDGYALSRPEPLIQLTDSTWRPFAPTPPTSAYPSEAAATGAAASRVLSAFFGANTPFTTKTHGRNDQVERTYRNFATAGVEAGSSEVAEGVNYRFAVDAGATLGGNVASAVLARFPAGSR